MSRCLEIIFSENVLIGLSLSTYRWNIRHNCPLLWVFYTKRSVLFFFRSSIFCPLSGNNHYRVCPLIRGFTVITNLYIKFQIEITQSLSFSKETKNTMFPVRYIFDLTFKRSFLIINTTSFTRPHALIKIVMPYM